MEKEWSLLFAAACLFKLALRTRWHDYKSICPCILEQTTEFLGLALGWAKWTLGGSDFKDDYTHSSEFCLRVLHKPLEFEA